MKINGLNSVFKLTFLLLLIASIYFIIKPAQDLLSFPVSEGRSPDRAGLPKSLAEIVLEFTFYLFGIFGLVFLLLKKRLSVIIVRSFLAISLLILTANILSKSVTYIGYVTVKSLLLLILLLIGFYFVANKKIVNSYFKNQQPLTEYIKWRIPFILSILGIGLTILIYW